MAPFLHVCIGFPAEAPDSCCIMNVSANVCHFLLFGFRSCHSCAMRPLRNKPFVGVHILLMIF